MSGTTVCASERHLPVQGPCRVLRDFRAVYFLASASSSLMS